MPEWRSQAYAWDLKSQAGNGLGVQIPPRAPIANNRNPSFPGVLSFPFYRLIAGVATGTCGIGVQRLACQPSKLKGPVRIWYLAPFSALFYTPFLSVVGVIIINVWYYAHLFYGTVAQLAEQATFNREVGGSIPPSPTMKNALYQKF